MKDYTKKDMQQFRFALEKCAPGTKLQCPSCKENKVFTLYVDSETGKHINEMVGRCSREIKCGYHYPPREYFIENKTAVVPHNLVQPKLIKDSVENNPSFLSEDLLIASLHKYDKNNFVIYLEKIFGLTITSNLIDKYFIGTSKYWHGATIFWQKDLSDKIRAGKIMLYDRETGKRVKKPFNHINWVHSVKKMENFELDQCLFGEHLLKTDLTKEIAIVESEKTAIIASVYLPQYIWLAVGGISNLSKKIMSVLSGRKVTLFPDLRCYEKWCTKAKDFKSMMNVSISDLFERNAAAIEKDLGLDIADFLIKWNIKKFLKSGKGLSLIFEWRIDNVSISNVKQDRNAPSNDNDDIALNYDLELEEFNRDLIYIETFYNSINLPEGCIKVDCCTSINFSDGVNRCLFLVNGEGSLNFKLYHMDRLKRYMQYLLDLGYAKI